MSVNMKSIKELQAEELNFRKTNFKTNCMNCKYNIGLFNKFEYECKLFNILIDEDHVCDLVCMTPKLTQMNLNR